jgi:hypothetical protein
MWKPSRSAVLAATVLLAASCSASMLASARTPSDTKSDVAVIYGKFLSNWNGGASHKLNVSKSADVAARQDTKQYTDCANALGKHAPQWVKANPISNLGSVIGNLPYVHFVDPKHWQAVDPGTLIAKGESVSSAVSVGMAHSLITVSAITFNKSHTLAMFQFSSVCGSLCGTGGVVVFEKTPKGWVQQKARQCAGWVS